MAKQQLVALRTAHRWLSWIVGVQVVIWVGTGFLMTLLSNAEVRSEHLLKRTPGPSIPADTALIPPNTVLGYFSTRRMEVTQLRIRFVGNRLVYDIEVVDGARALIHAVSGKTMSPLSRDVAIEVAMKDRASKMPPTAVRLLAEPEGEYRGGVPVWRVEFDDADNARLYISPTTGEIVERTNASWRIHDFVWMLHIMDYEDRQNYNSWLVRCVAGFGLLLALSGAALALVSLRQRRRSTKRRAA